MQQAQAKEEWLRGVKAIADFLGVSDRTVKRWIASAEGFPVHRIGGHYAANTADLRGWTARAGRNRAA